jgi:CheY-like chemotaxis protein
MARKILLIEDNPYIKELYTEILQNAGFEVDYAEDGVSGVEKVKNGGYDLVLLDMVMPKAGGLDVVKAISQNPPKTKNGPIILLTNLTKDAMVQQALNKGASSYIVKSDITPGQLIENVNKFLKP